MTIYILACETVDCPGYAPGRFTPRRSTDGDPCPVPCADCGGDQRVYVVKAAVK